MNAIEIKQLSFKYPQNNYYSLSDVTLNIKAQRCTGIIGPNGAGKSTFISALCGLIPNFEGSIKYPSKLNEHTSLIDSVKSKVSLVPQEYAFYPQLTVIQNLHYFLSLCLIAKNEWKVLLDDILSQCELSDVQHKKAKNLSGGYKRRLNIAIALVKKPDVLFLDEPTVGIDPESRTVIIRLLETFKKQGKTLLFTSHMLDEVEKICDDIIVFRDGKAKMNEEEQQNSILLSISFNKEPKNNEFLGLYEKTELNTYQKTLSSQAELSAQLQLLAKFSEQINNINYSANSVECIYNQTQAAQ
ncbi:ABC transporter ATP-binding protein [Colwellia sp. E2M01]|uniref:ABC transporter ATP-binding protein n=1 Tax=Colwellia sp. E2M01 TaxID=2841561 RepID=UPI001C0832F6|nr:ABC transporter ATP-binding protein [Colwellia sp. E2M01]MBU2871606.1 ABC transporter ATP-binding protein [Colwellia sp. E2M01]